MTGNTENNANELKKSFKEWNTKAQKTMQSIKHEVHRETRAINHWVDHMGEKISDVADEVIKRSNTAEKKIDDGYHQFSKDVKYVAKNISYKPKQ